MPEGSYAGWRKSSRSGNNGGDCVEIGFGADARAIRDTKEAADPKRSTLEFSGSAFATFLSRVKSGNLD